MLDSSYISIQPYIAPPMGVHNSGASSYQPPVSQPYPYLAYSTQPNSYTNPYQTNLVQAPTPQPASYWPALYQPPATAAPLKPPTQPVMPMVAPEVLIQPPPITPPSPNAAMVIKGPFQAPAPKEAWRQPWRNPGGFFHRQADNLTQEAQEEAISGIEAFFRGISLGAVPGVVLGVATLASGGMSWMKRIVLAMGLFGVSAGLGGFFSSMWNLRKRWTKKALETTANLPVARQLQQWQPAGQWRPFNQWG